MRRVLPDGETNGGAGVTLRQHGNREELERYLG